MKVIQYWRNKNDDDDDERKKTKKIWAWNLMWNLRTNAFVFSIKMKKTSTKLRWKTSFLKNEKCLLIITTTTKAGHIFRRSIPLYPIHFQLKWLKHPRIEHRNGNTVFSSSSLLSIWTLFECVVHCWRLCKLSLHLCWL